MKVLILLICILPICVHADLLARMNLEEAFRQRIETLAKTYDSEARVLIRFDYRNAQGMLPGTSISGTDQLPSQIDVSDIVRAHVEIYTVTADLPEDFNKTVHKLIPIPKDIINVQTRRLDIQKDAQIVKDIDAKTLNEIASRSVDTLTTKMIYLFSSMMLLIFTGCAYISHRRMKDFRAQMSLLTSAVAENAVPSLGFSPESPLSVAPSYGEHLQYRINSLQGLSDQTLIALLSDCYWCHEDGQAAWIWRRLDSKQKYRLIEAHEFLKKYSYSLQGAKEQESSLFEDPFYYHPQNYEHLSNQDLAQVVQKNFSLWHLLSPLRQNQLPLPLEKKLAIRGSSHNVSSYDFSKLPKSSERVLGKESVVTNISLDDEIKILENPEIIPKNQRKYVPTLVWLAQKDSEALKSILAKYDARTLASAWIAPEDTLKKLEACLPERKAKMVRSYLTRSLPTRNSGAFRNLYLEGLHEDAA